MSRKGTQSELIFSVSSRVGQGRYREVEEAGRLEAGKPKRRLLAVCLGQARAMAGKRAKPSGFPGVSDTVKEEGRE